MKIESYKRRQIKPYEDVWVYRNLMRNDGVWYSLMQRGLVVGHATEVALVDVRFIVREGGRVRVVNTGVKNVHAFVVGRLVPSLLQASMHDRATSCAEWRPARYNPRHCGAFIDASLGDGSGNRLLQARAAHLGPQGLRVKL